MEPKKLAEALKQLGFDVVRFTYASDVEDAGVEINAHVGVQIFTYEPGFCVVREIPKTENPEQSVFRFGQPRTRIADLATDLKKALEDDKASQG